MTYLRHTTYFLSILFYGWIV
uniref:Uncharacterized protein n=1 Tax=Rhizophora mucronata TaxID=61149 RepID=A0A2P2Q2H6_RHIMU